MRGSPYIQSHYGTREGEKEKGDEGGVRRFQALEEGGLRSELFVHRDINGEC